MKFKARILFVVLAVFVSTGVFAQQRLAVRSPHHFELSCENCHTPDADTPYGVGELTDNINQLCTSSDCHNLDPALNHPVDITPQGTVPSDLPLDDRSRLTCLTCHDELGSSDDLEDYSNTNTEHFLRRPAGMEFCASCHTTMSTGDLRAQTHWQASSRAHLAAMTPRSSGFDAFADFDTQDDDPFVSRIDHESRMCLTCHDDISTTISDSGETAGQKKIRWESMSSHPIGMDYADKALQKAGSYSYPISDDRIRLFNGRVGCGSCHSPYAKTENNLVVRLESNQLCRRCHNL